MSHTTTSIRIRSLGSALALGGVLLLATVLRMSYLFGLWRSPLFLLNTQPGLDMGTNYSRAAAIAAGRLASALPFSQAPLYPLFLAGLVRVFDASPAAVTVAHVGLGVLACALLYELGRLLASPGVGLLAAAIYAMYPLAWYYGGLLLSENLLVVVLLALVLAATHALESQRVRPWLAVGVLCGLGTLSKANVAVILPALILAAVVLQRQRLSLAAVGIASLAWVLLILPVVVLNSRASGSLQFVSVLGSHLWLAGNTAFATGLYQLPCGPPLLPWSDGESFWVLQGRKALLFMSNQEFGNNTSLEVFHTYLGMLPPPAFGFGLIAGFGLLGLALPPAHHRRWLGLVIVLGVYTASIIAFAVVGRYRLPAAALLCLPAATLLVEFPRLVRRRPVRTALATGFVLLLSVAANVDLPVDVSLPFAHDNAASAFEVVGDQATAQAEQQLAHATRLAVEANDPHACSQLPLY